MFYVCMYVDIIIVIFLKNIKIKIKKERKKTKTKMLLISLGKPIDLLVASMNETR